MSVLRCYPLADSIDRELERTMRMGPRIEQARRETAVAVCV
jgi:hypothetical protein